MELLTIPAVIALVEALKHSGMSTKYAPVSAIIIGTLFGVVLGSWVGGLVLGLAASGLYSGAISPSAVMIIEGTVALGLFVFDDGDGFFADFFGDEGELAQQLGPFAGHVESRVEQGEPPVVQPLVDPGHGSEDLQGVSQRQQQPPGADGHGQREHHHRQ